MRLSIVRLGWDVSLAGRDAYVSRTWWKGCIVSLLSIYTSTVSYRIFNHSVWSLLWLMITERTEKKNRSAWQRTSFPGLRGFPYPESINQNSWGCERLRGARGWSCSPGAGHRERLCAAALPGSPAPRHKGRSKAPEYHEAEEITGPPSIKLRFWFKVVLSGEMKGSLLFLHLCSNWSATESLWRWAWKQRARKLFLGCSFFVRLPTWSIYVTTCNKMKNLV